MALDGSQIGGWYNEAEFSDLTVELSDGTEVKVHKVLKFLLCRDNDYFRKLVALLASSR